MVALVRARWFVVVPGAGARLGQRLAGRSPRWVGFDIAFVWVVVGLLSLGLVMVYSASIQLPDNPKFSNYAPTYFFSRHIISIALSGIGQAVTPTIPMRTWEKIAPWLSGPR